MNQVPEGYTARAVADCVADAMAAYPVVTVDSPDSAVEQIARCAARLYRARSSAKPPSANLTGQVVAFYGLKAALRAAIHLLDEAGAPTQEVKLNIVSLLRPHLKGE